MINADISIDGEMWDDFRRNWYSNCHLSGSKVISLTVDCWHHRSLFYCDGWYRVPVPPTLNGEPVFFTNIAEVTKDVGISAYRVVADDAGSGLTMTRPVPNADVEYVCFQAAADIDVPAKFAELIVVSQEAFTRHWGKPPTGEWTVVAFHATPCKDLPPPPLEMALHLGSKWKGCYHYTVDDFVQSTLFWSRHCIIR
jgi:hypothetical protein